MTCYGWKKIKKGLQEHDSRRREGGPGNLRPRRVPGKTGEERVVGDHTIPKNWYSF